MLLSFIYILLLFLILLIILSYQNLTIGLPIEFKSFYINQKNNLLLIFIMVFCIILFLIIIDYFKLNFALDGKVTVDKVYNVTRKVSRKESFLNSGFLEPRFMNGFCNVHENMGLDKLDQECNKLSKYNCLATNCCGMINDKLCVAGYETGPAFTIDNYKNQLKGDNIMHYLDNYIWNHKDKQDNTKPVNSTQQLFNQKINNDIKNNLNAIN